MKIKYLHIILFIALVSGCSLKRNTSTTRAIQAMNTRYNVYFNGSTSFEEGIKSINQSNSDDYSNIINMYAISKHENANSAKPSMDRTIEKCRKAIKLHSIKKKPERNNSKWSDPEYKAWYNQTEFNPALKDAWLLLGKAEFHKADFLGSVGTFMYISRYYPNDKDVVTQCQLWIARAYAEMGWLYEAEQVISKIKQDDLKGKNAGFYAAVNADLLLKRFKRTEAIPFLELALKSEKDKIQKQRFTYLLAQLYQKAGNTSAAYATYSDVLKLNPDYAMDFNARINRAGLNTNTTAVRKELKKMILNPNNKEYKDQLFYAMGKTYLTDGDTLKAIENFIISADTSTRKGFDKAQTLITLADLYYNKQNYIKAQPRYDEAAQILTTDYEDYNRISKRAETLNELLVQHEIVVLQDSLQKLAALPVDKRKAVIQAVIDKKIADEKAAQEAEKLKQQNENRPQNFDENFDMMPPLGMAPTTGEWYFYNANIIKTGASEFRKKWGNRKLEDNWRRSSKSAVLFSETAENTEQAIQNDTTANANNSIEDDKTIEFYLRQIPTSAAQLEKSDAEIATALYNMGFIYKDKIEDIALAIKTFDEFERRFPTDKRRVETYYNAYILALKNGDNTKAETYKAKLINSFPTSKYVEVVSQPDYFGRMERMLQQQDSLYAETYQAYNNNKFDVVKTNTAFMQQTFPLSELMPKFLFLNALSKAKTGKQDEFETSLNTLIDKYPASDVSSMAKDIVALVKQGKETKTSSSHGTLLSRRTTSIAIDSSEINSHKFIADKSGKHRLMIVFKPSVEMQNKLLFNIASYNFTRFMVKDFDLINTRLDSTTNILSVTNFESYDEAEWYLNSISGDATLTQLMPENAVSKIIISEINYSTMFSYLGLAAYQNFCKAGLNNAPKQLAANTKQINKPIPVTTVKIPEQKVETKPVATQEQKLTATETKKEISKPVQEQKQTEPANAVVKTPATTAPATPTVTNKLPDNVPLFKNLFGYIENEPHYISINVLSGNFDFEKVKAAFDAFNAKNYSMLNLKIRKESFEKQQIILIGPLTDANIAKSYLLRIVKEKDLYTEIDKTDYRNLLGSQRNLNIMMQNNAMDTYFEFMQQYYLK